MNPWQKLVQFFVTFRMAFATMRRGRIWLPFLAYAITEALVLAFTYFGVRPPLTDFFAGPLSFMVPDAFFHYPVQMALLPAVFYRFMIPLGVLLQSLLYAAGTLMFVQHMRKTEIPGCGKAFSEVKPHYGQFAVFALISLVLFVGFTELYNMATENLWTGYAKRRMLVDIGGFCGGVLMNCVFAYATVVIVVERTRFGATLARSLRAFGGSIVYTFLYILFGSILLFPLGYMMQNAPEWMGRFNPEVMVLLLAGNIVIGMIAYFIGTATLTFWYIFRQDSA